MPHNEDYRGLVAEKFSSLTTLMNAHFETVYVSLDSIKKDTTRTNGRVTVAENEIERLENKLDEAIKYANHVIDSRATECPNVKRFEKAEDRMEKLENRLEDLFFLMKYPKVFIGIIVFFVLVSLVGLYQTIHSAGILRDTRFDVESTKIEAQQTRDAVKDMEKRGEVFIPPAFRKDTVK